MPKRSQRAITVERLRRLWSKYTQFRATQLAPSTIKRDYTKIARRLKKMADEAPDLDNAIAIRDWLLANYSAETARRTLVQLNAACKWAMNSELIGNNPFAGVAGQIKKPRQSEKAWVAFTIPERDRIIQEFESECLWGLAWVKFLFYTGARPEEAAALRWEHVASDYREILIAEAFPVDMQEPQGTKNGKITRFPCNVRLQNLLRMQHPAGCDRRDFVFPGPRGGRFDYHGFQTKQWKPIVESLRDRGYVAFYLSQYHARHTFITEALKAGMDVAEVSYLCRVSTDVIYRHYLGRTRKITVPEF